MTSASSRRTGAVLLLDACPTAAATWSSARAPTSPARATIGAEARSARTPRSSAQGRGSAASPLVRAHASSAVRRRSSAGARSTASMTACCCACRRPGAIAASSVRMAALPVHAVTQPPSGAMEAAPCSTPASPRTQGDRMQAQPPMLDWWMRALPMREFPTREHQMRALQIPECQMPGLSMPGLPMEAPSMLATSTLVWRTQEVEPLLSPEATAWVVAATPRHQPRSG
jgi:hypothetical protein